MNKQLINIPKSLLCNCIDECFANKPAEDGYKLWLRYAPLPLETIDALKPRIRGLMSGAMSQTLSIACTELERGLSSMLLDEFACVSTTVPFDGAILFGTAKDHPLIAEQRLLLEPLGKEGYLIKSVEIDDASVTLIVGNDDMGVLYGCFAFLRMVQSGMDISQLHLASVPKLDLRMLNHWDNLDGSVERGYAGSSIWDWWTLPDYQDPRYADYARANASIGINGTVLNNVNASPMILNGDYLKKAAKLADIFRPFGIKVFLAVNFATPCVLDGLETADPMDALVRQWWKDKVAEIYKLIPDFGGFLVKANSEGQPGPGDYDRSHADGANMIAEALAPHDGILIWRAFVYASDPGTDRATEAYDEFKPLDGAFLPNIMLQVKNGPIDFQPREPFSPIFGQITETPVVLEFQVTKEYLGQATHLVYLGKAFEEVLRFDTYADGEGSTVARIIQGEIFPQRFTGMAAVSNIGNGRDWTGGIFNQANWYAFGRLAWNPELNSEDIAREWVRLTFCSDEAFVEPVVEMMMSSHETLVDYMTPFGLHHQMATGHHYGPGPWIDDLKRPEWNPSYYNQADEAGIGFDRTDRGSGAIRQYAPELWGLFGDKHGFDEKYLLWFHHVAWDFKMKSGKSLWDSLVIRYDTGISNVEVMQSTWQELKGYVDCRRFAQIEAYLAIQLREAKWWRDACIAYFMEVSGLPLPEGHEKPGHTLDYYKSLNHPFAPGNPE
ncbi:alpha-glucuronidase family glycosyl hydrolase [uncultured Cohaesibacter sp.]|uniref:alpha-glucuronidase family glycosyl hydrolase n=1 Tax=uncultured Cohaesibacter sp. TaxID=1002546 RepID=UPI00292D6335|nr:alpha-glucuronidase family glycosyl hydrolase [uncultured Cohaesibacter sp.]